MPRSEIARLYGYSIFSFWGTSILFSIMAAPICIPTNSVRGLPFLHIFNTYIICRLFFSGIFFGLFSVKPQQGSAIGICVSPPFWNSLPSSSQLHPLGWYRAPVWVSWDIQQIPIGYLFYICWAPKSLKMVTAAMKLKDTYSLEEKLLPT